VVDLRTGYIGLTDPDWYGFLSTRPHVDEVNFWQPHGSKAFRAISPGEPFFFKLRAPEKAIAGFGFFERFQSLTALEAWELFCEMNGAPDFSAMIERITRLRGADTVTPGSGDFLIGCVLIAAPVFFKPPDWVFPPKDWARTGIQQGKRYSLDSGEGARIFRECLERASVSQYWNVDRDAESDEGLARYGSGAFIRPRLGQGLFSLTVRDAYGGACAVPGEHSRPVLEAAHIVPYSSGGQHRVTNGLLLRSDLHRLYDHGYVTVTPDYEFRVGDALRKEFHNGRSYYVLNGHCISVPKAATLRPDRDLLEWHQQQVFKG
jgi:putative restriction endonuclease